MTLHRFARTETVLWVGGLYYKHLWSTSAYQPILSITASSNDLHNIEDLDIYRVNDTVKQWWSFEVYNNGTFSYARTHKIYLYLNWPSNIVEIIMGGITLADPGELIV